MKTSKWVLILLFCCLVWAAKPPTRINAQVAMGDILGVVSDPTGAVVPDATITLHNINTHSTQEIRSDRAGGYTFPQLPSGTYEIAVTARGFNRAVVSEVVLRVGTRTTVNIKLEVGTVATSVEVRGAATLISSSDVAIGQIVTERGIVALPLNARNYLQLANLAPGMNPTGGTNAASWTGRGGLTLTVAGMQEQDVSFLLEGIETRSMRWGTTGFRPSIDAIAEFNVQRNALTADQGVGTAVVNTVLRSGSNSFHGTVYEFIRNDALDARNFFDPTKKPPYKQNQFGFTLGGPIRKDKLFFFGTNEGFRRRLQSTLRGLYPTSQQLAGVFSTPITDPLTGQPFLNNTIPPDRFDDISKKVIPYFPAPNASIPGYNYVRSAPFPNDVDQYHFKVDMNLPNNDRLFARYSFVDDWLESPSLGPGWGLKRPLSDHNAVLAYTHIFSPNVVNVFRLGFNRDNTTSLPASAYGPDLAKTIGFKNTTEVPTSFGLPGFTFSGGYSTIGQGYTQTQLTIDQQLEVNDNLSLHRGNHDLKVGANIRRNHLKFNDDFPSNPSFTFQGNYTGNPIADFLLGFPYYFQWGIGDSTGNYEKVLWTAYVQDNYRIKPNLTLYFGLRYEYDQPPTEINDRQGYFDLWENKVKTIKDDHLPRGLNVPDKNNWGPRLGFAYTPFPKTVIRAAGGVYYGLVPGNEYQYRGTLNPPFYYVASIYGSASTRYPLEDQFPPLTALPLMAPNTMIPTDRTPYFYQYNFHIQHEFPGFLVEAGYVGSTGHKINRRFNNNIAAPAASMPGMTLAQRRPHQGIGDVISTQNDSNSNYNGFNLKVDKPMGKGLLLLAAYTLGKDLNIGNYAVYAHRDVEGKYFNDMRGPSQFDTRQRLSLSYVYELPFGRGKHFLTNAGGAVDKLVNGWQITGITTFASGHYITPVTGTDRASIGGRRVQPLICIGPLNNKDLEKNIRNTPALGPYFNVQNLALPAAGTMGNCGKGVLREPGINNWDLGLLKVTQMTERLGIQFRAETFNTWNHAQFTGLSATWSSTTFGRLTSARDPRDVQFALKIIF